MTAPVALGLRRGPHLAAALLLALASGGVVAARAVAVAQGSDRLPLWDMAGHGWGGVELLLALREGRLLDLLSLANAQDKWPFGFSLLLLPWLAAGELSFASAAALSALALGLAPALLVWLAAESEPSAAGPWIGLAAGVCAVTAPLPQALATVTMRETTGTALALLAAALWLRAVRCQTVGAWRAAGLALLALFWTKFNYALLLGAGLAVGEFWVADAAARAAAAQRFLPWLWPGRGGRPVDWARPLVAVGLALAAALGANPGPALYLLLLALTAVLLARAWRSRRAPWAGLAALPSRTRGLVEGLALPLWIWALSPSPLHLKSLFAFLRNRPADAGQGEARGLVDYLGLWAGEYAVSQSVGFALLAAAALALAVSVRQAPAARRLAAVAAVGFALTVLHPYHEARFFATVSPFVLLVALQVLPWLGRSLSGGRIAGSRTGLALLGASALAAAVALHASAREPEVLARHRTLSGDVAFRRPLDWLAGRLPLGGRSALLGGFNELSPNLLRWRLALRSGTAGAELVDEPRSPRDAESPAERAARLERWLREERPLAIVAVRPLPGSALASDLDFQRYNARKLWAIVALEARQDWRRAAAEIDSHLGLELLLFVPLDLRREATRPSSDGTGASPKADPSDGSRLRFSRAGTHAA